MLPRFYYQIFEPNNRQKVQNIGSYIEKKTVTYYNLKLRTPKKPNFLADFAK